MAAGLGCVGHGADVAVARRPAHVFRVAGMLGGGGARSIICLYVMAFFLLFGNKSTDSAGATEGFVPEDGGGLRLG